MLNFEGIMRRWKADIENQALMLLSILKGEAMPRLTFKITIW